jgi:predicted transglutaminase-like cysteine proteinase
MAAVDYERMSVVMGQRFGAAGTTTLRDWQKLLQEGAADAETVKLRRVNEFFNRRVRFSEDQTVWGQSDYWATPVETLGKGAGDCEDFAIAKYFSLLLLGLPVDKLRLIYVQARMGGPGSSISQAHMVLAFYSAPGAEPLVLDNLIDEVRPASRRTDLVPVFSFNSQGLWQGISGARGTGGPSTLSRWQDLLSRARAEGFDGNWFEEAPKR